MCARSEADSVRFLVWEGPGALQERDTHGRTLVHCAIDGGWEPDVVRSLLRQWPGAALLEDDQRLLPLDVATAADAPPDLLRSMLRMQADASRRQELKRGGAASSTSSPASFEARLSKGIVFKQIMDSIEDFVVDATLFATQDGLLLQGMDAYHVSLVDARLRADVFDRYRCDQPLRLHIKPYYISKILKGMNKDDTMVLKADAGEGVLKIAAEPSKANSTSTISSFGTFRWFLLARRSAKYRSFAMPSHPSFYATPGRHPLSDQFGGQRHAGAGHPRFRLPRVGENAVGCVCADYPPFGRNG
jgi:Proliferating cell nuclear antigen, N-terminal domain